MTRIKADLLLLVAALIWGAALYFQKSAMTHIGPMLFIALRSLIAAVALAPFAMRERPAPSSVAGDIRPIAAMGGLAFLAAAALQQIGLVTATVINAGFFTSLYVVATPLVTWLLLRKTPAPSVWVGAFVAFCGAWALGGGTIGGLSSGDWLILVAAFLWGAQMVITDVAGKYGRPLVFTCLQFVFVALCAGTFALALEPISFTSIMAAWKSLLFVGLLSSALTYAIFAIALRHTTASEAAILISLDTVFAAAAGYFLLGERLNPIGWVGAAMMFAAVLIVQLAPRLRQAPAT
jgi:drug/metabolite transporter (DMT)-like permease